MNQTTKSWTDLLKKCKDIAKTLINKHTTIFGRAYIKKHHDHPQYTTEYFRATQRIPEETKQDHQTVHL